MAIVEARPTKKWTADEVERLMNLGAIAHPERYFLMDGELREKMSQNLPHIVGFARLFAAIYPMFGPDFHVAPQTPVKGDPQSEPEPDLAVYRRPLEEFIYTGPRWTDLALVVEIADTSLAEDRTEMTDLYARFAVPEYWILDLNGRTLEVRRAPKNGVWTELKIYDETETVAPLDAPEARIPITDLLPPLDLATEVVS